MFGKFCYMKFRTLFIKRHNKKSELRANEEKRFVAYRAIHVYIYINFSFYMF